MNGFSLLFQDAWQWWIFVVAALTCVACGTLGSFLVLRRMSLMGDAISHAVLPGLVLAFVFTGSLHGGVMLAGAFVAGLITTWLIQTLERSGTVAADAGMGVVFTSLFALGVVLIAVFTQGKVDLDVDCVLQGSLSTITIQTVSILGWDIPRAAVTLGGALLANLAFIILFWKELQVSSFDAGFAAALGLRPNVLHYLLMAMTAMTAVAAFEAVGSILVIAMLIVPGATAQLLTDRLKVLVPAAGLIGLLTAFCGVKLSLTPPFNQAEPAALAAVCAGGIYALTVLFAPHYGIAVRWWERSAQALRILCEDLLAMFYRIEELAPSKRIGTGEALQALGGGWLAWMAVWSLRRRNQINFTEGGWQLTTTGRQSAKHLIRSHRLWESWLVRYLGLPPDHVHAPAERMEHFIGGQLAEQLRAEVGELQQDPHGKAIPQ